MLICSIGKIMELKKITILISQHSREQCPFKAVPWCQKIEAKIYYNISRVQI